MKSEAKIFTLGIVGIRGYVGQELLGLIVNHPALKVDWISSRQLEGQSIKVLCNKAEELTIETLSPQQVAGKNTDVIVLALPNGLADPYVAELEKNQTCKLIIDLSADYRFHSEWFYSVPEIHFRNIREHKGGLIKISNPGCYATSMQVPLAPLLDLIDSSPHCFGVSGFSGAGTTPSANNDPVRLKDNLIPYSLVEHLHEKEVSHHLGRQISFTPHVASFFRGINMTIQLNFSDPVSPELLYSRMNDFYAEHPLIKIQTEIPTIQEIVNTPDCLVGGIKVSKDGKRATIISCLDNLLKGAASQALQNINLALGLDAFLGLDDLAPSKSKENQ